MLKIKNKKGVIDQLIPVVIILVTVAIMLVVGFMIFQEGKDVVVEKIDTTSITLEEFTGWTVNVSYATTYSGNSVELSCSGLHNDSLGKVYIGSGNYTCGTGGVRIENYTVSLNDTLWVNYTYKEKTAAWNATTDVQNATQDIPGWLPIIVITIIGSLLIGLVQMFRRR